jgi:Thioredoxin
VRGASRWTLRAWLTLTVALSAGAYLLTLALLSHPNSNAAAEGKIDHEVSALFTGIPQQGETLGKASAPITLEVFIDLKDPDSRTWFLANLPAIVHDEIRTGTIQLQYHAYKTGTYNPREFVKEQTAALAASTQNKLWNYIDTFYHEQGNEFTAYATNANLALIARQIPGLNLTQWQTDRHTGRREEQTTAEDQTARTTLGLHVTPSFRIGKTGGTMHNFSGHAIITRAHQLHPVAFIEAKDINTAIKELDPNH